MFGLNTARTKLASKTWTLSRLERAAENASESKIALDLAVQTLQYDAETIRNLGHIDLANVAFNTAAKQFNGSIAQTKQELRSGADHTQSLAQKFKYAALQGS